MAKSPGISALKNAVSALTAKEMLLAIIGVVLLVVGLITGSAIVIIAVLLIAVGLWGYVYFSLASRTTSSRIHHNAVRYEDERLDEDSESGGSRYGRFSDETEGADAGPAASKPPEPRLTEAHLAQFFDLDSGSYPTSSEPRSEFEFLLGKVLAVLKESLIAHTAAFFWINFDKQEMVFQGRASDSHSLAADRKLPMNNDIVSRIARNAKAEFVSHISPNSERDLLPYYQDVDFVKSFIGVPVFYQGAGTAKTVVGVLAIDSKAEDAFGSETLGLLSQFTRLLSALIKSHTEKYDLLVDSELLESIRTMHENLRENLELRTIVQSLMTQAKRLIGYDYFAVTMFNDDKRTWIVYHVDITGGGSYVSPHQPVNIENSLAGSVLELNKHLLVDDLSTIAVSRFNEEEKIDSQGTILIAPISSFKKCYGTVSLESRERSAYSARDIEVLYRLVENSASALEILYMAELVDKYVIIDDTTGLLKRNYFEQRLRAEIHRADDLGSDMTFVLFSIDNIQQLIDRYGKEGMDTAVYDFAKFLQNSLRPYDLLGRMDYNRFGVVLVNTAANEGYLWAEKIRKNFAGQVLTLNNKTTSVTVSSGVCGLAQDMQYGELSQHVAAALQKAMENGGNVVRVY
jgi:diguanylate cyclase (GGDEF)-like protein